MAEANITPSENGPYIVSGPVVLTAPDGRVLDHPDPMYSHDALEANISGQISAKCIIKTDGTLERCRILKGLRGTVSEGSVPAVLGCAHRKELIESRAAA